jgi:hypothetical protein
MKSLEYPVKVHKGRRPRFCGQCWGEPSAAEDCDSRSHPAAGNMQGARKVERVRGCLSNLDPDCAKPVALQPAKIHLEASGVGPDVPPQAFDVE